MNRLLKSAILLVVSFSLSGLTSELSAAEKLRSAFLGPTVWENGLTSQQINQQLRDHFAEVLERLEARNASSLLTALLRAEAGSTKKWSKADRRAALFYLAHNRQKQIEQLRYYKHRGLFPINEGQASEAVPIFVDQRKTHCAVGYLMHVDGRDAQVAQVVEANNLVKIMDASLPGLANWIRTSGLTREEAAMIQPGYPIEINSTLGALQSTNPVLNANGYTMSDTVIKHTVLDSTLLAAPGNPVELFWESGRAFLNDTSTPATNALDDNGVKFGSGQFALGTINTETEPNNLDDWLYFGATERGFGTANSGLTPSAFAEDLQLFSIDYLITPDSGRFTQFALTSGLINRNTVDNTIEFGALRILAEVYDGASNQMLGSIELSADASPVALLASRLDQVQFLDVDAESLRIKTFGLRSGSFSFIDSVFHEFETVAIPEPTSATFLFLAGAVATTRRRR